MLIEADGWPVGLHRSFCQVHGEQVYGGHNRSSPLPSTVSS
jgi:hypothetical protein